MSNNARRPGHGPGPRCLMSELMLSEDDNNDLHVCVSVCQIISQGNDKKRLTHSIRKKLMITVPKLFLL